MRPLVFHEPIAEVLFWVSLALWYALEQWVVLRSGRDNKAAGDRTHLPIVVLTLGSVIVAIVLASQLHAPLPGPAWWPVAAGLTLLWAGMAFRLWAVLTLGSFFKVVVVIQENHRVIDRGPYRWLRHPSYTGMLGVMVGLGLAEDDWFSLAVMLVFPLIALLIRIRAEERALLGMLGAEYAAYSQRTARLVPGVF